MRGLIWPTTDSNMFPRFPDQLFSECFWKSFFKPTWSFSPWIIIQQCTPFHSFFSLSTFSGRNHKVLLGSTTFLQKQSIRIHPYNGNHVLGAIAAKDVQEVTEDLENIALKSKKRFYWWDLDIKVKSSN